MKASELIAQLQKLIEEHGDLRIEVSMGHGAQDLEEIRVTDGFECGGMHVEPAFELYSSYD